MADDNLPKGGSPFHSCVPASFDVTIGPVGTPGSTATFDLTADEAGVTYQCTLNSNGMPGIAESCTSPKTYTGLQTGSYLLSVTGTDAAGNVSFPVPYGWTVGSPAPGGTITSTSSTTFNAGPPQPGRQALMPSRCTPGTEQRPRLRPSN